MATLTPTLFSSCLFIVAVLFSCFASVCSYNFADENPIRLLSDGQHANHVDVDDHPSFPRLPVEAIYQFGDSLSDTGNLIRADPSVNCANWPYGVSYLKNPTGRCSDGLLIVDYFAKFLKLPLIDAYLDKDGDFKHGVNFAVGGATALNVSFLEAKFNITTPVNLSLSVQLDWFKSHLHSFYPQKSERRSKLGKGLFLMGEIGGNDYNFAFLQGKTLPNVYDLVPHVIQAIRNAVEEIIDLGATQIAIPGNFPIGCVPIYLSLFKTNDSKMYDELKCLKQYNEHAIFHNGQLRQTIKELQKGHPNASIVYMDYYGAFKRVLHHAKSLGFDETTVQEACCGTNDNEYKVNITQLCGTEGVPVCKNPGEHVSWDGTHLTQHAYQVIAKQLMSNDVAGNSIMCRNHLRFVVICLFCTWAFFKLE